MFQGSLKGVSRISRAFQSSFREVSRVFKESSKGIQVRLKGISSSLMVFEKSSTGKSGKFQWCFKEVSKMFQGSFRGVPRKL